MCGIAGKIYFKNQTVSKRDIHRMNQKIQHRGPDDEGIYISQDEKIGLGHARLSIIDLSKNGHQPMNYRDRYYIVFNGEIYNFQEKRENLKKKGYTFTSQSDTEVILALYDLYREDCLKHLRGMFAFAIFDQKEKTVFCARDRVGKKPFKYFYNDDVFIFASELKAILTQPDYTKEPDYTALHHYFTLHYCPAPLTGFKNIKKLEPAHYLMINLKNHSVEKKRYWQLDYTQKHNFTESEWKDVLMSKIEESVQLRMISDVPVGAFLSGGVDSSAIVAIMSKFSTKPIETFSIGFEEEKYNELEHARVIAEKFKTNHNELIVDPQDVELLPEIVRGYEEPYADSSALPTYYLSQFTKQKVTVALNGDGGDENFAGYLRYTFYKLSLILEKLGPINKHLVVPVLKQFQKNIKTYFTDRSYRYMDSLSMDYTTRYLESLYALTDKKKEMYYTNSFKDRIDKNEKTSPIIAEKFHESQAQDKIDQVLYTDIMTYLPDDLLVKVDIASMMHGIESRSPLLDHELLELSAHIPSHLKLKGLQNSKYILKKTLEGTLPHSTLYRQKKGFGVPIDVWFQNDLKEYAHSKLLSKKFTNRGIFSQKAVKEALDTHTSTNIDLSHVIWNFLMLELWFEEYFD